MMFLTLLALTALMAEPDSGEFFFDRTCAIATVVPDSIRFSDAGYLPETGTSEQGKTVDAIQIDLNHDGLPEIIVPYKCGTDGCRYPVFDGKTGGYIGEIRGDRVLVRSRFSNGFAILQTYLPSSDDSGTLMTFAFDGHAYTRQSSDLLTKSGASSAAKRFEDAERWTGCAEK